MNSNCNKMEIYMEKGQTSMDNLVYKVIKFINLP